MNHWRPSTPIVFRFLIAFAIALFCSACAVDQGVEAELSRKLPDGTEVSGKFSRKWAGGPVELEAEVDPDTGAFKVRWSSDVDLDPAARASMAQAEAQAKFLGDLSALLRTLGTAAAGVPSLPSISSLPRASTSSRAELGGKGPPSEDKPVGKPPKLEIDPKVLDDLDEGGGS